MSNKQIFFYNSKMNLIKLGSQGDYTIFMINNGEQFVVAYNTNYNGNNVWWTQGHYFQNLLEATMLLIEKTKD